MAESKVVQQAPQRVALVAGASGLTGAALLRLLLIGTDYARILAVTRRPLLQDHPRLANRVLPLRQEGRKLQVAVADPLNETTINSLRFATGLEIAVTDSGPGIPQQGLEEIFNPLFTTKPGSLGLGLALSRTIVEAHGGRLWAENRKDHDGAVLRMTLPAA